MNSPNPNADKAIKQRLPALAPKMPAYAFRNPRRPPFVIQESMTGPGLAETTKVIDRNKLKFVIGIRALSTKTAILVELLIVSQYKLGYLAGSFEILFYTQCTLIKQLNAFLRNKKVAYEKR